MGRERKGSTFLSLSDMSDQNASSHDNLQASAGTRNRLGVRRLRDENPVGPPTAARDAANAGAGGNTRTGGSRGGRTVFKVCRSSRRRDLTHSDRALL